MSKVFPPVSVHAQFPSPAAPSTVIFGDLLELLINAGLIPMQSPLSPLSFSQSRKRQHYYNYIVLKKVGEWRLHGWEQG